MTKLGIQYPNFEVSGGPEATSRFVADAAVAAEDPTWLQLVGATRGRMSAVAFSERKQAAQAG